MLFVLPKMLDLDGHVVGDVRKFAVERFYKLHRVPDSVEKIRIAKRNVLRAGRYLLANIRKHDLAVHNAKNALVHRDNRTVPAKMLATTAGFRRSDHSITIARNNQVSIFLELGHSGTIRHLKVQPLQRDFWFGLRRAVTLRISPAVSACRTQSCCQMHELILEFPAKDRPHSKRPQILRVHRRI